MSTKKLPSASDAHNITELRKKLANAESEARSAKNALKSAKQRAKETKRELKKARKVLKRATERKVEASKRDPAPKPRSKSTTVTKTKSQASRKEENKPRSKKPSKEGAPKTRELGLRVANSPETRRRARVKKSTPVNNPEPSETTPVPAVDEAPKE
jgi:hypothetical protein